MSEDLVAKYLPSYTRASFREGRLRDEVKELCAHHEAAIAALRDAKVAFDPHQAMVSWCGPICDKAYRGICAVLAAEEKP